MRQCLAAFCGFLLVAVPAGAQSKTDQDKTTDHAQVVSTAEIVKIDAKKKSLQVREVVQATATGQPTRGGQGGGGSPRVGGGGGRARRPGGGYPGGGGRYPGGGGGGGAPRASQAKEYKVFAGKDTTFTFANAKIDVSNIH